MHNCTVRELTHNPGLLSLSCCYWGSAFRRQFGSFQWVTLCRTEIATRIFSRRVKW